MTFNTKRGSVVKTKAGPPVKATYSPAKKVLLGTDSEKWFHKIKS